MKTILCLASFEKGQSFMEECHAAGWNVLLISGESLRHGNWPWHKLKNAFFVPDPDKTWNIHHLVNAVGYVLREQRIDVIAALDDFDVEKAATLREHFRIPGMGETTARNFRDKLAMRGRAKDAGVLCPNFTGVFNNATVAQWMAENPAPYVLKPRLQANAIGIKKIEQPQDIWPILEQLGDQRLEYVLECFVKGQICHVDSAIVDSKVVFACASQYGTPPMEVFHAGRVFTTQTLADTDPLAKRLKEANQMVMKGLGLKFGVSHTEFIVGEDDQIYFLETSARVGGAHIADMVEAATGVNLWREWARIETAEDKSKAGPKASKKLHAALLATLAQQTHPDMSRYDAPEVVWKMNKPQHAGLIIASKEKAKRDALLKSYLEGFYKDFFVAIPAAEKASQMA